LSKSFRIGNVSFNDKKCVIIAEAGVNHNGSLKIAEKLIVHAKKAGADIIKFQTYKADKLVTRKSPRFWNWSGENKKKGSQYDSYERLDKFDEKEYREMFKLCKKNKIEFMSTPFDIEAVDMLYKIGVGGYKVASCDINNYQLLSKIAEKKLPILLSTGASELIEIKNAVNFLKKKGAKNICVMQCTLCYPTAPRDINLRSILNLKKIFSKNLIGFSDHSLGVNIPSASVLYGVRVIEKHFTINKKLKKSADHWLSINPNELSILRRNVDELLNSLGNKKKKVLKCEQLTRRLARRSIVAKRNINKGEKFSLSNIMPKRPGGGISPMNYFKILGKKAQKDFSIDEKIKI
jgi:N,N'-diacetyllegionaminate synthase